MAALPAVSRVIFNACKIGTPLVTSVPSVREDCFGGEVLRDLTASRTHAVTWCRDDYGVHIHTRTQRRPREHFEAEEDPPGVIIHGQLWCWACGKAVISRPHVCDKPQAMEAK